jgi:4-amino-4-deoxy-L-arabinose transferase-like glycosyltransferase
MSTTGYRADPVASPLPPLDPEGLGGRALSRVRGMPLELWLLGGLIALAAVLRFTTIASQSLWTDEALTSYEMHLPFHGMLHVVTHVETTPPLYFVLVWGWSKVFGTGVVALRFISALAGVGIVPLAYASARELFSRWAGVIAAAFMTINPFLIWYSQEARSYSLLAMLSAASFLWFVRSLRAPTPRNLTLWTVSSALALMTHFFAGFLVAPEALWLLWANLATRRELAPVAAAAVALAAVQAAMLPFALADTSHGAGWIHQIPLNTRIAQVPLEFGVSALYRRATATDGYLGAAVLIALLLVLVAWRGAASDRRGAKIAGGIAAAVVLVPLLLGRAGPDYFLARNVIAALVPLAVVAAGVCAMHRARAAGALLAIAILALFGFGEYRVQTKTYLQKPDWRAVAQVIGPARGPTAILAAGGSTADPLKIYLHGIPWIEPRDAPMVVDQVVVVGSLTRTALASDAPAASVPGGAAAGSGTVAPPAVGFSIPRLTTPPGTVKVSRIRVHNFVIARYRLRRPWRVHVDEAGQLVDVQGRLAPRFFHRLPLWVLEVVQRTAR